MKPRALGVHKLCLTNRLAGDERCTHDHAREILKRLWPVLLADEISSRGRCRPFLPANIGLCEGLTSGDVRLGDKDVDGVELGRLRLYGRSLIRPASKQGGNATSCQGNSQDYDTCSFHTLTLTVTWRPD